MVKQLVVACCFLLCVLSPFPSTAAQNASTQAAFSVAYRAPYFNTESAAQTHCPRDVVVWLNIPSGIYHYRGERWYARTRHGAFVCEKEALAEGDRASRNGQ